MTNKESCENELKKLFVAVQEMGLACKELDNLGFREEDGKEVVHSILTEAIDNVRKVIDDPSKESDAKLRALLEEMKNVRNNVDKYKVDFWRRPLYARAELLTFMEGPFLKYSLEQLSQCSRR